jgi:hypothetical protein
MNKENIDCNVFMELLDEEQVDGKDAKTSSERTENDTKKLMENTKQVIRFDKSVIRKFSSCIVNIEDSINQTLKLIYDSAIKISAHYKQDIIDSNQNVEKGRSSYELNEESEEYESTKWLFNIENDVFM